MAYATSSASDDNNEEEVDFFDLHFVCPAYREAISNYARIIEAYKALKIILKV